MSKKAVIAIILHNPSGSSGLIGQKLAQLGYEIQTYCPLSGDDLPNPKDIKAAIFFGGQMSVNDFKKIPELAVEKDWIYHFVNQQKPFLGICLGAQLLAQAFGGKVTHHQDRVVEIGYYGIYPTLEGFSTIFDDYSPEKFFQWHNEGFTIPENAVKLAASDLFANQAFRMNHNAFGFQFHPEITEDIITKWHQRAPDQLKHPGAQTITTQWRDFTVMTPKISLWLDFFLSHWLEG